MRETNYYVVNLEDVIIEENHPYTLIFKGSIPTFGSSNKLYTFKYDGSITYTDASMPEQVKRDFEKQLWNDFKYGYKFDINKVKAQLERESQYRMEM